MTIVEQLPLAGVRVIDFTTILAGPHLTQWLATLGAEVIKVETVLRAESRLVSVVAKTPRTMGLNESDSFAIHNHGKKSIRLNMKRPEAVEIARRLIAQSSIVAENFGGDVMARWGLGFDRLSAEQPGLIFYAGSGYGRTGKRSRDPIYAPVADAQTGLTITNGYAGGAPYTLGSSGWTDIAMAMHGAFACLAAFRHARRTGQGQYIDTAMIEVEAQFLAGALSDFAMNGRASEARIGNGHAWASPHGCYPAAGDDRWIAIAAAKDAEWTALVETVAEPWIGDAKFADHLLRWDHREELDAALSAWTRKHDAFDLAERLRAAGVPATASLDLAQLRADPQLAHRNFYRTLDHAAMGALHLSGIPQAANGHYSPSPLLGEHQEEILGGLLGMTSTEIAYLEAQQVLH